MFNVEKSTLQKMNKVQEFKDIMRKLTLNQELDSDEKSYILSCAIILLKYYQLDKRHTSYFEFAYYIILKYSITYVDYQALYDFAVNFGFYPIVKNLIENGLVINEKIYQYLIEINIDKYNNNEYIETYEQKLARQNLMKNDTSEICYVAPTSYGKSSIIVEHIKANKRNKKIGIIVPTKSLLIQTYRRVRKENINTHFIIHDEMYQKDKKFIAILTQERALRLLERHDVAFDIMYIDEAHNLFGKDSRSILLSRLIRKNFAKNLEQKIVYLSPLIKDSDNLKVFPNQRIRERRIKFNMKEPEYYEYRLSGDVYKYNRFVNDFFKIDKLEDAVSYVISRKQLKNFIYIRAPKKIEMYAKELYYKLPQIKDLELNNLINNLKNFVHEDFYIIKLLEKGIIYLHGKMPDIVKEYLESKYNDLQNLKYVVANSVILEGVNLPIDALFILNTYGLRENELINLVGRVNRLNQIFTLRENNLNKLLPQIHFVNTALYNRENSTMTNKIKSLRSRIFEDKIQNPILNSFDVEKLKIKDDEKYKYIEIKNKEDIIFGQVETEEDSLKKYLIEEGFHERIRLTEDYLTTVLRRINRFHKNPRWTDLDIIDKIYRLFIYKLDNYITDFEFSRLKYEEARNYYKVHMKNSKQKSLKENINSMYVYFKNKSDTENALVYVGESYGEIEKETEYISRLKKVYVNLSKKSKEDLINLAIVKLKMEDDFISYTLNKFIIMMYDYELISDHEYNLSIYGTNNIHKIALIKTGLTLNLISKLSVDNQLENLYLDENRNIRANEEFQVYRKSLNDFYKFEIDRFL